MSEHDPFRRGESFSFLFPTFPTLQFFHTSSSQCSLFVINLFSLSFLFDSHLLRVSPSLRCITELPSDVIIRCPAAFSSSGMLEHKLFVASSPSASVLSFHSVYVPVDLLSSQTFCSTFLLFLNSDKKVFQFFFSCLSSFQ